METYDAKIDEMYALHDNPELAGKSIFYINEHPEIAFPEEDRGRKISNLEIFSKGN